MRLEKRKERKGVGGWDEGSRGRGEHEDEVGRVTVNIMCGLLCVKIQSP